MKTLRVISRSIDDIKEALLDLITMAVSVGSDLIVIGEANADLAESADLGILPECLAGSLSRLIPASSPSMMHW